MLRYHVKVGRPREHDESTRVTLLRAAEHLLSEEGHEGLSMRRLAAEAETSTRAVYSLFGGKQGLIAELYRQTFDAIGRYIDEIPPTEDPVDDLVSIGIGAFRRHAMEHPNLFRLVFERLVVEFEPGPEERAAGLESLQRLFNRAQRLVDAGLVEENEVWEVTFQFHAQCQGLASIELRGWLDRFDDRTVIWRRGLRGLLRGLVHSAPLQRA